MRSAIEGADDEAWGAAKAEAGEQERKIQEQNEQIIIRSTACRSYEVMVCAACSVSFLGLLGVHLLGDERSSRSNTACSRSNDGSPLAVEAGFCLDSRRGDFVRKIEIGESICGIQRNL